MNRRDLLKILLGIAAGAALPVPLEALAEQVALPGEGLGYTLWFWISAASGPAYLPWAVSDAQLADLSAGLPTSFSIPLRAETTREAINEAYALLRKCVGDLCWAQLEYGGPSKPYVPTIEEQRADLLPNSKSYG